MTKESITPEEFEKRMRDIKEKYDGDYEMFNEFAIYLMLETLESLGYDAGINIYSDALYG